MYQMNYPSVRSEGRSLEESSCQASEKRRSGSACTKALTDQGLYCSAGCQHVFCKHVLLARLFILCCTFAISTVFVRSDYL